ncbi:MAG: Ig-like domain-containing protein [Nocardioidaceae bacterium]
MSVVGLSPAPAGAAAINDPPGNNHSILSFPVRDFVSGDGYTDGDLVTVEVLRAGHVVGTATGVVPTDDPTTPGFDGLIEVNHPGGSCWEGVTPDIRAGDIVRTTTASGQVDQTHVTDVTVTDPATKVGTAIVEKGTAADAAGSPLPLASVQARIIANRLAFDANGKRDIRAPGLGTLTYDAPGSTHWTATWSGLNAHDQDQAVGGESRGLWLGTNPGSFNTLGSPVEATLYEFGQIGGPAAPCTAPLATGPSTPDMTAATDSGVSTTDDITSNAAPTFVGASGTAPVGSVTNLYVDGVLNGTGTVAAGGTYSLAPLTPIPNGVHSIRASEVDAVSGIETQSAGALTVTIDTAAPTAPAVRAVAPGPTGSTFAPSLSGTAEPGSTVTLFTDATCTTGNGMGTAAAFNSTGVTGTAAANSTTTFWASTADAAGNSSACSTTSMSYTQDGVAPPSPTIDSAPASPSKSNSPSFTFSDTEAGVTFACSMSTGASSFSSCTSPKSFTGLADGDYTFTVRASDAAGNTSTATVGLSIDTTPPTVTIDSAPASPSKDNTPTFGFSSQPGSTFQCSMSTGADSFTPCASPMSYPALADGAYTFKVKATDPAGNAGVPVARTLTIDTVAPAAVITGTPPNPTSVNTPSFDFASADATATFQCSLTLASSTLDNFQSCVSPNAYPARADGSWVFKVKATDPAGNTGAPATYAFTINTVKTTAPGAPTIGTATAGSTNATVTWSPPTSDGGSAITEYRVQVLSGGVVLRTVTGISATATSTVVGGLTNGQAYTFRVRAINAVGAGPLSTASNTVTPARTTTVPGAPVIGTATQGPIGGALTAVARWSAPASDGGSPVTGYQVITLKMSGSGAGATVLSKTTSAVFAAAARSHAFALAAGNYRFQVVALNAVGKSIASARSNNVVPR